MYSRTKVRQQRNDSGGWKKRSHKRSQGNSNSRFGKNGFTGATIDIRRFVNKAETAEEAEVFTPQHSFDDLKIIDALKRSIKHRGFVTPTPIQDKAIPAILTGSDVIGLADTGTGKTGAFLIPMIHKILTNRDQKVLIVAPVRELAIQIQEDLQAFSQKMNIHSTVVVGGANIQRQIKDLRRSPSVVIGTPGRLKDLISRKRLDLSKFNNVILDEADRMLDMGFIADVKLFLSLVAKKRQIMLFSATFSSEINNLAKTFLNDPTRISLKTRETSKQVDQDIVRISRGKNKVEALHDVLNNANFEKALVFTRTKHGADKLSRKLHQKGFKSDCIHGNKPHNKRQRVLMMFKKDTINVLVATDVAARGLDIPNVSHVINFDIPATYEDYIHRIGRTGRAEQRGIALTFVE